MRTDGRWQRFYAVGWVISVGGMAVALGMWRLHLREVEQRAEEAERTRDEVARRRAVEERLRIARELHDSLTHSISVIQVQAGVAVHLTRKRGEEVPPALLAIHEAGADAARELRATLGVLRSQDNDPGPDCDGSGLGQLDGGDPCPFSRAARDGDSDWCAAAASARGRPGGVPDRPGGAHQHQPPRRLGRRRSG